jgi:hypothetical protein
MQSITVRKQPKHVQHLPTHVQARQQLQGAGRQQAGKRAGASEVQISYSLPHHINAAQAAAAGRRNKPVSQAGRCVSLHHDCAGVLA